jgi:hypothetical protein
MASTLDINFNNTIADYMTAPSYSLYEEFYSSTSKYKQMDNEKQKSMSEQKKTNQTKKKIQKSEKNPQKYTVR